MHSRQAALAAWVAVCAVALPAAAADPLTLDQAFARVVESHPELRLIDSRGEQLAAERDRAALEPPLVLGVTLENAAGTGEAAALDAAEFTLSLASVLERGDKRAARTGIVRQQIDALALQREARRLDLLAEVARRYLAMVAAEHRRDIAEQDAAQRQRAVQAARARLRAGAAPESALFAAQAALARAGLERARSERDREISRRHLAALWGERSPEFTIAPSDPLTLPAVPEFQALVRLLEAAPELARFAGEERIREARLQLARSASVVDLEWQVGIRRLEATEDMALIAGVSVPLGSGSRSGAGIRAAQAELTALEIEREAGAAALYSTLAEAHGRLETATLEVHSLRDEVIPQLGRAAEAAERAWRAGAAGYLEWAQLQTEHTAARRQQLDAALDARRALIEIQRLTGSAFALHRPVTASHGASR